MVTLKPAWLVERELPNQLLEVGTQLLALPSSSKGLIGLLDKVGNLFVSSILGYVKIHTRCFYAYKVSFDLLGTCKSCGS